jgi:hypothetical protein
MRTPGSADRRATATSFARSSRMTPALPERASIDRLMSSAT